MSCGRLSKMMLEIFIPSKYITGSTLGPNYTISFKIILLSVLCISGILQAASQTLEELW